MSIIRIHSIIKNMLNICHPVVCAPMANVTGGILATRVTECGGLGLIGVGYSDQKWLENEINLAKKNKFGVGFITWQLAKNPGLLDLALKEKPRAIWLSFGDMRCFVSKIKQAGVPLICQVQTVQQAKECKKYGADIIVAQGTEAGGHGATRSLMALLPAVVDAVKPLPVMAAGGIVESRGFAAALMLGAQGIVMGSRFLASDESLATDFAKQLVLCSSGDDTIRSNIFDHARGYDWPKPYTGRTLHNDFSRKWLKRDESLDNCKEKILIRNQYLKVIEEKDDSNMGVFIGEGIDMIHHVLPTQAIVENIIRDLNELKIEIV